MIRGAVGDGIEIGAHSVTHRSLPALTDGELDYEVEESRSFISRTIGAPPEFFAYPYGQWNSRVRDRVRGAGFRGGLTLNAGLNRHHMDAASLRRINIPAAISDAAFQAWVSGF